MKNQSWKSYLFGILSAEIVGIISAWISHTGMQSFSQTVVQPPFAPPAFLFPAVWSILYALMGISAARIFMSPPSSIRNRGLNLYMAQLIVNFFWSPFFFRAQAYGFSFFWLLLLWVLVLRMILVFYKIDPPAAYIQIPYLLWLTFAAYLSYGIWQLNK